MKFGSRPLENLVHRFWEIEKYKVSPPTFTVEESLCEEHFVKNVSVNNKGRIQVRLPFKGSTAGLGQSYEIAQARSSLLEKRMLSRAAKRGILPYYIYQKQMRRLPSRSLLVGFLFRNKFNKQRNCKASALR